MATELKSIWKEEESDSKRFDVLIQPDEGSIPLNCAIVS